MNKPAAMPASRFGGVLKLMVLFTIEVGFIVAFHALGSIEKFSVDFAHFSQWIDTTPPEVALVASIRIIALVFSYWMLSTSILYMLARSFRIPGLLRAMELTTIPGVRRTIDAGLAAAIIGGTVFGGAGAVFAKQAHSADKIAHPTGIETTYKDSRVLYNPTPTEDATSQTPAAADTTGIATRQEDASTKKVVAAPVADDVSTPAKAASTPLAGAARDPHGNYVPGPTEEKEPTTDDTSIKPDPTEDSTTTSGPKVVVPPTTEQEQTTTTAKAPRPTESTNPSESTTAPTTTSPKVTVPPTTAPVTTPTTTTDPDVTVGGKQVTRPDESPTSTTTTTSSTSYTVVAGDNFWNIARDHVRDSLGREPSNAEVANYWVKLIDANRSSIRSGDPDLIFPGEIFTLPAL